MKRIFQYLFTIFLFVFFIFSSFPLLSQDVKEFSTPMTTGGHIKACEAINLLPGFSFVAAEGKNITFSIDKNVCTPYIAHSVIFSDNQNYILSITPLDATDSISISENNIVAARDARFLTLIQYYDGLARPTQTIQRQVTPEKKDLITLQEYDKFGRDWKTYLPYPKAHNNGAYHSGLGINQIKTAYESDLYPYNETVYENSPLDRVVEEFGPGDEWRSNSTRGNSVRVNYLTNHSTLGLVYRHTLIEGGFKRSGTYHIGRIQVIENIDEDGNLSYEFKTLFGETILTRQINDNQNYDTYYIYDDHGELCYVIPPILADSILLSNTYLDTDSPIKNYAYIYKYDEYKRCTSKKIPGSEPVYYKYDNADRLIFSQDGEQRLRNEWSFFIPDIFGRTVVEGICKNISTNSLIQTTI